MYLFVSAYDQAEDDAYEKMEKEKSDRKKKKDKEKPDDRSDVNTKIQNLILLASTVMFVCPLMFCFSFVNPVDPQIYFPVLFSSRFTSVFRSGFNCAAFYEVFSF